MTTPIDDVLEMLADDMVSHGWLVQYLEQSESSSSPVDERIRLLLTQLLSSSKVEIGIPEQATPEYLEFVAWKGTVEERVRRALAAVDAVSGHDELFAYWLCLRENVDRFEGEQGGESKRGPS